MATHSSSLAWRIPWTGEPGGLYSPRGCKEWDTTERFHFHISLSLAFVHFTNLDKCIHNFLTNLYARQEATVLIGHGTTDWFQIGKGVRQGCILSPLFNLCAAYIM